MVTTGQDWNEVGEVPERAMLDWLDGPMTAKLSGSPNENYEDAMGFGIDPFLHGTWGAAMTAWYQPNLNGSLAIYFEFSPYGKPNNGILRPKKGGASYSRRFDPAVELRGLSRDAIAGRAVEHIERALQAVSTRKDLDASLLPTTDQLLDAARHGQAIGPALPWRQERERARIARREQHR